MEFKGTKGKWLMDITSDEYRDQEIIDIESDEQGSFVTVWSGGSIDETTEANALLISKAPEMLEMLKDIYQKYEKDGHLLNVSPSKIEQLIKEATEL